MPDARIDPRPRSADDPMTRVIDTVRATWGFDSLRPIQEQAIRAHLERRDSLVVMPTGGGKSLCYQAPPLVMGETAIVVSPLIALMDDQVSSLTLVGYSAAALHGNLSADEIRDREEGARGGKYRLLFIAPERLLTTRGLGLARALGVRQFAIDEAHCISHWGHDFRPEYRRLADLREAFPGASLHAYTATASPRVREDISAQLGLREPAVLVGGIDRPNLTYRVRPRFRAVDQIAEALGRHAGEGAIVYCIARQEAEQIAAGLSSLGIDARAYHAGLSPEKRRRVQRDFSRERLNVVVATVAFGMGIDRGNVRAVIHAAMPKSIEHYQQETGRAGRDGLEAECLLLYSSTDPARWRHVLSMPTDDGEPPDPESLATQLAQLDRMARFASSAGCRHRALCEHFGQDYAFPNCNACDACLDELRPSVDGTDRARKILSCVARVGQSFGAAHVADVLLGRGSARIRDRGHDTLSTHGLLRGMDRGALLSSIEQLVEQGLLARTTGEYPVLRLTAESLVVMRGEREVRLLEAPGPRPTAQRPGADPPGDEHAPDPLFDALRALRRRLADERGVPPFMIVHDSALREMSRLRPASLDEMRGVRGIGERKLADFGEAFLAEIARARA